MVVMKQFAEVTEEINEEPKEEAEADVEPDWEELMKLSQLAQTRTSTQPAEVAITAAARVDAEKRELTPTLDGRLEHLAATLIKSKIANVEI